MKKSNYNIKCTLYKDVQISDVQSMTLIDGWRGTDSQRLHSLNWLSKFKRIYLFFCA